MANLSALSNILLQPSPPYPHISVLVSLTNSLVFNGKPEEYLAAH